jgi:Cu(I)/Ag(I) efflux system protein CusF
MPKEKMMAFRFAIPVVFTFAAMVSTVGAAPLDQRAGQLQMAQADLPVPQGKGTVNSVDAAGHKINLSHEPIPAIGWPAMKMNFPVAAAVDLKSVKPGTQVEFTLAKNKAGTYEIQSITPAGK